MRNRFEYSEDHLQGESTPRSVATKTIVRMAEDTLNKLNHRKSGLRRRAAIQAAVILGSMAVFVIAAMFVPQIPGYMVGLVILGSILAVAICLHFLGKGAERYKHDFTNGVLHVALKAIYPTFFFDYDDGFSRDTIWNCGVIDFNWEKFRSSKMIQGAISGHPIQFAEVSVAAYDGDEDTPPTTFSGTVIRVGLLTPHPCSMIIGDRSKPSNSNVRFWNVIKEPERKKDDDRLEINHAEFMSTFRLFASHPQVASDIISPEVADKIMLCQQQFGVGTSFALYDNCLWIAVPGLRTIGRIPSFDHVISPRHLSRILDEPETVMRRAHEAVELAKILDHERTPSKYSVSINQAG